MQEFSLASVVIPASDGTLRGLGFDVRALGEKALGFVVETRASKVQVQFPGIRLSLWLDKNELADVGFAAAEGRQDYRNFLPVADQRLRERNLAWIVQKLSEILDVKHILGSEQSDSLLELWNDPYQKIEEFYSGSALEPAAYLGLGLAELSLEKWHQAEAYLGDELYFARFLPAGMHKLELSLYLRR